MTSKVLCDLPFIHNQPLKSADDQNFGILKNKTRNLGYLRHNLKKPDLRSSGLLRSV